MPGAEFSVDAARQQAFGPRFEVTVLDPVLVEQLNRRVLQLPPHGPWTVPDAPDWREDPFHDGNWRFQYHALRWLDPLRRRAAAGDGTGMQLWERYARSWVDANPVAAGGSPAWGDMAVGLRAQVFAYALPYVEAPSWLVLALREHGSWLADPENVGRHSHALHQHVGLLVLGLVLQEKAWVDEARARLSSLLRESFDDEGANDEGSTDYALLNTTWFRSALRRISLAGLPEPESAARVTDLAPTFLAHASEPDGRLSFIGDSASMAVPALDHPATTFVSSRGCEGTPPAELFRTYRSGYAFGRSSWGRLAEPTQQGRETFFSLRFGAQRTPHGRADGGAITYTSGGVRWITGTGKFSYDNGSAMRRYVCSRQGQNTITVKGLTYDSATSVRLVRETHDGDLAVYRLEDDGYPGVRIHRTVCYSKSGEWLLISDVVRAHEAVDVEARLHLGVAVEAEVAGRQVNLASADERATILFAGSMPAVSALRGCDEPVAGWVSEAWKERSPATELVLSKRGRLVGFLTVITPLAVAGREGLRAQQGSTPVLRRLAIPGRDGVTHVVVEADGIRIIDAAASSPDAATPAPAPAPATPDAATPDPDGSEQRPAPPAIVTPAASGVHPPSRGFDLGLFRQLQDEYRDRPLKPTSRTFDQASLTAQARSRAKGLDRMIPVRGTRLLEVGCGRGHLLRVLSDEYECDVVGVDIADYPEWEERPDLPLHVHDIAGLENDSLGTFDRIVSFAVWEHVVHPFAALKATRQLLRPGGLMYLNANLYRGPKASHRYREIYFPWPHLLFQDDVFAQYYVEVLGGSPARAAWVNKLTTAQYLTYFELLDFSVESLDWAMTPIDEEFYGRFERILGRYPRYDLERDFIRVIVTPGRPDPAAEHVARAAELERRLELAAHENEALRRRVEELTRTAQLTQSEVTSRTGG